MSLVEFSFLREGENGYLGPFSTPCRVSQVALVIKNLPAKAGDARDVGLIPGLGRCPGVENDNSFQYSCLENSMGRGA